MSRGEVVVPSVESVDEIEFGVVLDRSYSSGSVFGSWWWSSVDRSVLVGVLEAMVVYAVVAEWSAMVRWG